MKKIPNFIVIGAARSGTTSLFQYLDAHPQIGMSPVKELNFFSRPAYEKKGVSWYSNRFPKRENLIAIGEASTSYTTYPYSPDVAARIAAYNPEMRLVYVVRNPLERYVSHFLQRTKAGHETRQFDETFQDLEKETFAWQGRYYYQLSEYLRVFPKEQLMVISFDHIKSDTNQVVQDLYRFLGVPEFSTEEVTGKTHNAAGMIYRKNAFGLMVLRFYHAYIEQRNLPFRFKKLFTAVANWGAAPIQKPVLKPEQRQQLMDFYREDSQQLANTFSIRTEHWFDD
ncbi:sulfotransferase family protein [Marinobacter sp.]|uniref:sulfotransferase family protein n=1 Tax=Marinobacter sp. TaxID=50741 RepID=UPI003A93B1DF